MSRPRVSRHAPLLVSVLLACGMTSCCGDTCRTAVEFTRHVLLSLKTRTGALVLPAATNATNSNSDSTPGVCTDVTPLRSLWSSSVRLTPVDQTVCLMDRDHCLQTMVQAGTVVLPWSDTDADRQVMETVLKGPGAPDQVTLLLLTTPSQRESVRENAVQLNANVGTDVWEAELDNDTVSLTEIYTACPTCNLTVHHTEQWSRDDLTVLDNRTRQERRGDLGGITLRAVGVKVFPIYTAVDFINGTEQPVGGVFFELASALASDLNFRLNITLLEGYAYGKRLPDGTYTGMVGELQAGRADMTVSEVSYTNDRDEVIDYTQTVSVISRRVYVHVETVLDSWMTRYSKGISLGMVSLALLSVVCLALTQRFSEAMLARTKRKGRQENWKEWQGDEEEEPPEDSLADTFWIMLGLMLQQGADDSPRGLSSRITFLSCLFLGLLLSCAYSATLISFLSSAGNPRPPFADLQGLTKISEWKAGWKEGELLENVLDWCALRGNPIPDCVTLSTVWTNHVLPDKENNLVQSYEEGFEKVARGKYAFIAPNEAADYQLSKMAPEIACRVQKLDVEYALGGIALGLQNNSPYKELFDQSLQRLDESGVTEKLYRNIMNQRETCGPQLASATTLLQTLGAFLLLLTGMVASGIILCAERLLSSYRRRRAAKRHLSPLSLPRIPTPPLKDIEPVERVPRTIHVRIKTWY